MAEHTDLTKLCRICGNILNGRVSYLVKENLSGLQSAFQEDFEQDVNKIHPPKFCNKCYCTMQNCNLRGTKTSKCPVKWKEGSASNFSKIKSKGGRPIKSKKGERPKKNH